MRAKLDSGQTHFLRLIAKEQECPEGWASVSKALYPLVQQMPTELVEHHSVGTEGRGQARLTVEGMNLLIAMAWL